MSNLNTFADVLAQQNNRQPISMTLNATGNSPSYSVNGYPFLLESGMAILDVPGQLNPIFGPSLQARSSLNTPFKIRASGTYSVNAGTNCFVYLSLLNASLQGLNLGGVGNTNIQTTSGTWFFEYTLSYDNAFVRGFVDGWFGSVGSSGGIDAGSSVGPLPRSQSFLSTLQFVVSAAVLSGNPVGNVFTLTDFSADLV